MSLGLYLHIPYCFSKCRYCDFYSASRRARRTGSLCGCSFAGAFPLCAGSALQPDTLYFGGGTPSLLRPEQAERLIAAARPLPGAEITLEANPETVTERPLQASGRRA